MTVEVSNVVESNSAIAGGALSYSNPREYGAI